MPCIYADFTQEPSLAPVFTLCPNKAHPDLNSCHLDSAEKEKNKGLGPARAQSFGLFRLSSCMQCVFWNTFSGYLSHKKWRRIHVMLFVYFAAWELSPVLAAPFLPRSALSWVFLWLCLRFGLWAAGARSRKHPCSRLAMKGWSFPRNGQYHSGTGYCGML